MQVRIPITAMLTLLLVVGCDVQELPAPVPISYAGEDDGNSGSGGGGGTLDIASPPPAGTPSTQGNFPRLSAFIGQLDRYSEAEKDTIARFEIVSLRAAPSDVSDLLARSPDARLYYRVSPQTVAQTDWGRDWSWMDHVRRYAAANDWLLRHHDGTEASARGWGEYWRWLDFTSHCPDGTLFEAEHPALDSRGLGLAEWMSSRFIPWFTTQRMSNYEGLWWEVVAEEPSRLWFWFDISNANGSRLDWNRNGVADFAEDGWEEFDRFVADWKSNTTTWMDDVRTRLGYDYPIIGGGDAHAPSLEYFQGFKNEDFLNRNRWSGAMWTWWDEFYTHTDYRPRRGYAYQRDNALASWDLSINQIFWYDDENWQYSDPELMRQYVRFALGTTLLGDGLFCFYDLENRNAQGQPRIPWISDYYDLPLGTHAYPMERHVVGADTVYTRHFHDGADNVTGYVAVNPNDSANGGIPAHDAIIEAY